MKLKNTKTAKAKTRACGLLAFYVNVGMLPPEKASKFVDKYYYEATTELREELEAQGWRILYVPVREGLTRIEMVPLA